MHGIGLLLAGLALFFSREVMEAGQKAAQVFATNVLPALFPMMVLGGLIGRSGASPRGRGLFLVLFGFCAGSPAAARQTALLHECSPFSRTQLMPLLCMGGVMSPMFFTGSLAARLGSATGFVMLLAHWAGALCTGGLCRLWMLRRRSGTGPLPPPPQAGQVHAVPKVPSPEPRRPPLNELLTQSITSAAGALLSVLGAMMLFSILAALPHALLRRFCPALTEAARPALALLQGLLEVGSGSFALLESGAPPWLLCALCSFGGLSIWLQNLLFLGKMINPAELLCWRTLHGAMSGIFCFGLLRLLPAAEAAGAWQAASAAGSPPLWGALLLIPLALPHLRACGRSKTCWPHS